MSTSESQTALSIDALVVRATFESPFAGPGIQLERFARVAKAFDLTLGTAWLLGAEQMPRMKGLELDVAKRLARWNQTGLLGVVARDLLRTLVGDSMRENDSAMPRVTYLNVGPPLDISVLLPTAAREQAGVLAVSFRMLERVFATPPLNDDMPETLKADIAAWLATRSPEELRVIDVAADEIASPPRLSAARLEIAEPGSDGH
jgi:hypothetical protein